MILSLYLYDMKASAKKERSIQKTIEILKNLPGERVKAVQDFAEYLLHKYDDYALVKGIEKLSVESNTFEFLEEDEELYTVKDLKEKFK